MAKSGIDYFPLDVNMDQKMELIEAEFGLTGFGVIVHLLQEIYGKAGYYIEWTNEVALLFARKVGLGGSVVSEIVNASIRRGMFDQKMFEKYHILTSRGIQKRYFEAVSRRKSLEVDKNILLVDCTQILKNVDIVLKNVNISSENVDIFEQSKVEKSKVKYSKLLPPIPPTGGSASAALYLDRVNPSASQRSLDELLAFEREMGAAVCERAIEIALDNKKTTWAYIRGILHRWQSEGVKSMADIEALEARHEREKQSGGKYRPGAGGTAPQPGKQGEADQRAREDMERLRRMMKGEGT